MSLPQPVCRVNPQDERKFILAGRAELFQSRNLVTGFQLDADAVEDLGLLDGLLRSLGFIPRHPPEHRGAGAVFADAKQAIALSEILRLFAHAAIGSRKRESPSHLATRRRAWGI